MKIDDFSVLVEYAKQLIADSDSSMVVVVLQTDNGVVYSGKCKVSEEHAYVFIDQIKLSSDSIVKKIVCMFHNGQLDVPSYALRKTLIELNESNKDAEILLLSSQGLCTRKLQHSF